MRKAFSLVELMIVAAVIGILAALCAPYLQDHAIEARRAAAKDNLRVLREAIRLYAVHHADTPPGYPGNSRSASPTEDSFQLQLTTDEQYCLRMVPDNPFNDLNTLHIIADDDLFPVQATGNYGWVYQPATGTIRLDWPGADGSGVLYFEY